MRNELYEDDGDAAAVIALRKLFWIVLALGLVTALIVSGGLVASAGDTPHCPCPSGMDLRSLWECRDGAWVLAEGSGVAVEGDCRSVMWESGTKVIPVAKGGQFCHEYQADTSGVISADDLGGHDISNAKFCGGPTAVSLAKLSGRAVASPRCYSLGSLALCLLAGLLLGLAVLVWLCRCAAGDRYWDRWLGGEAPPPIGDDVPKDITAETIRATKIKASAITVGGDGDGP